MLIGEHWKVQLESLIFSNFLKIHPDHSEVLSVPFQELASYHLQSSQTGLPLRKHQPRVRPSTKYLPVETQEREIIPTSEYKPRVRDIRGINFTELEPAPVLTVQI